MRFPVANVVAVVPADDVGRTAFLQQHHALAFGHVEKLISRAIFRNRAVEVRVDYSADGFLEGADDF